MNKKTEDFLGADAKKDFFSVNSSILSEINKFKNSILNHKVIQIKHLISGKLKILNLNLSKIYENKIFKGVLLSIDDITELISAQKMLHGLILLDIWHMKLKILLRQLNYLLK